MIESHVKGLRSCSPQDDLATFTALLGDGSYSPVGSEGLEITETNGFVGIAEHGSEYEGANAGQRGQDGGVGVGEVGFSLLLEPPFEEQVGVTPMMSNEK
jgi:hypothetical protein